jgi:hypothetical protein
VVLDDHLGILEIKGLGLERFRGAAALLDAAQPGLDSLRELGTTLALHTLHEFLHPSVRTNAEAAANRRGRSIGFLR